MSLYLMPIPLICYLPTYFSKALTPTNCWKIGDIGPILDDRLKEEFLKPWKGVLCIHFRGSLSMHLCVCSRATEHIFWPRNLIFWFEWSLGHEKETHFFFEILIFTSSVGYSKFSRFFLELVHSFHFSGCSHIFNHNTFLDICQSHMLDRTYVR